MLLILLGISGLIFCYWKLKQPHKYWLKKNVKQEENPPFLLGDHFRNILQTESFPDMILKVYNRFSTMRYSGMYQMLSPILILRDPELIKQITVKDFDHFVDHRSFVPDGADDLWTKNLFALKGDKWRDMRATLSPAFTSSKMKAMFNLISECGQQFVKHFEGKNEEIVHVEMKDIFTRYANDVIATCAFGVKCDSLKERDNQFYLMGKDATNLSGFWQTMKLFALALLPFISKVFGFTLFSKKVSTFFKALVKDTLRTREQQHIVRPDMIHLLMEARKGRMHYSEDKDAVKETGFATVEESEVGKNAVKTQKEEITDIDITAQALIFFFAGFETISTMMCFLSYELAVNPDIQDRLIEEIDEHLKDNGGKVTYEVISKMKYLDMVVTECLRKWPAAIITDRVCIKPYTIEPTNAKEQPVHLAIGDVLFLPIFGIHRDPQYYPNPDKFDPERFNDANKDSIHPYAYTPFGAGPRNCIGSRFALLEAKTVFVHMLNRFRFVPIEKTDIPFKLSKKQFNLNAANGFWLGMKKRIVE